MIYENQCVGHPIIDLSYPYNIFLSNKSAVERNGTGNTLSHVILFIDFAVEITRLI